MTARAMVFCAGNAATSATNGLFKMKTPRRLTVVHVSVNATALGGSPTNANVTINDGATPVLSNVAAVTTAGTPGEWKSKHVDGTNDAVDIAAGSTLAIDLGFSGGTSPTATNLTVTVWALPGVA
ncbi:MAG: hypothetical protein U0822_16330 [Anaerolineae bacterium]